MSLKTLWSKLFPKPQPLQVTKPSVGQKWRSGHSGRVMEVMEVEVRDNGRICVTLNKIPGGGDFTNCYLFYSPDLQWDKHHPWVRLLKDERRELIA